MAHETTAITSSKGTAIKAVAERGSKAATDMISLEYQSLVGDYAFSAADRAAFAVAVLHELEEFTTTKLVLKRSVVSPAGYAIIRTYAMECSKSFAMLQEIANVMKRAYRKAERDRDGKIDQWISRGFDWPCTKEQCYESSEALELPTRNLLLILNVVKLAYARMVSEKSWDENISRHQHDLQRAIIALHAPPKIINKDGCRSSQKTMSEPTRLHDIVEETGEDSQKADSNSIKSEKTRVESAHPGRKGTNSKTVTDRGGETALDPKDRTAVSIRSSRSEDSRSFVTFRRRDAFYRILRHLPLLSCFSLRDAISVDDIPGTLEIHMLKPFLGFRSGVFELAWNSCRQVLPDYEVERQFQRDCKKAKKSITEQLSCLTPEEDCLIQAFLTDLRFKPTILSLWRETITLKVRGITIKDVPTFRIIVSAQRTMPSPSRSPRPSVSPQGSRPTYVKVHRNHMEPMTLDEYHLPWEWEEKPTWDGICEHIIIKQWLPEGDQDILFEHTRRLREVRPAIPGLVGVWPPKGVEGRRKDKRAVVDDGVVREGRRNGEESSEEAREENAIRAEEENELVERLLREYTIWKGKEKGHTTKAEDVEGKEKVEEMAVEEMAEEKADETARKS